MENNNYQNNAINLIKDLSQSISFCDTVELDSIIEKTQYYISAIKEAKNTYTRTVLDILENASIYFDELYEYHSNNIYSMNDTDDNFNDEE